MRSGAGADVGIIIGGDHRNRHTVENLVQQIVRGHVVGEGFVREYKAMPQHIECDVKHVLGQGVHAPPDKGECPCGEDQVDRGAWACAEHDIRLKLLQAEVLRRSRCAHNMDGVLDEGGVYIYFVGDLLQFEQLIG